MWRNQLRIRTCWVARMHNATSWKRWLEGFLALSQPLALANMTMIIWDNCDDLYRIYLLVLFLLLTTLPWSKQDPTKLVKTRKRSCLSSP